MGGFCPDDSPRTYREPETTAFAPDGKCWKARFQSEMGSAPGQCKRWASAPKPALRFELTPGKTNLSFGAD